MQAELVNTVLCVLHDAQVECERLHAESSVLNAIIAVQDVLKQGAAPDELAPAYSSMTDRIAEAVMAEDNIDRSYALYDVLLLLYMRTAPAFDVLYPGASFATSNRLYFKL